MVYLGESQRNEVIFSPVFGSRKGYYAGELAAHSSVGSVIVKIGFGADRLRRQGGEIAELSDEHLKDLRVCRKVWVRTNDRRLF